MSDNRNAGRRLTPEEHTIAEQGLLNLCIQASIEVHQNGVNITPSLLNHAARVNAEFDELHAPKKKERPATPKRAPRPEGPRQHVPLPRPVAEEPEPPQTRRVRHRASTKPATAS